MNGPEIFVLAIYLAAGISIGLLIMKSRANKEWERGFNEGYELGKKHGEEITSIEKRRADHLENVLIELGLKRN